jgi:hypothetical protein
MYVLRVLYCMCESMPRLSLQGAVVVHDGADSAEGLQEVFVLQAVGLVLVHVCSGQIQVLKTRRS